MNVNSECRLCGSADLRLVADLGAIPPSHRLRTGKDVRERRHPLLAHYCAGCGLVQIVDPVPPEMLYVDVENYNTSYQHHPNIDEVITTLLASTEGEAVVEIACNDGYFLRRLANASFSPVIGIEPNRQAAAMARGHGLTVFNDFLSEALSHDLVEKHGRFDIAVARHVVEHLTDLALFFRSLDILLAPNGLFLIELPYVEAGFRTGAPCVLWEEHVNYFTEPLIDRMLQNFGYEPFERRYYGFGGGVIAVLARRMSARPSKARWGENVFDHSYFQDYGRKLETYRKTLHRTVKAYRDSGYRIALYGVGNRSCTTVNSSGVADLLDFVIDDRPELAGRYAPGTGLAVKPLGALERNSDRTLILLGVGAEHERKVKAKASGYLGEHVTYVSLFYPRDAMASFNAALKALG